MKIALFYNPQSFDAPPQGTLANMDLIFLGTRIIDLHFAAHSLCLSSFNFFSGGRRKTFLFLQDGRFSRSKSHKVNNISANRKRTYDFLLVRNSNCGRILHRFVATARFMCSWPHPYATLILRVFPLHQIADVRINERMGLKLFGREIIFEEFQPMWSRYLIVIDGQTDGRHAISWPRSA